VIIYSSKINILIADILYSAKISKGYKTAYRKLAKMELVEKEIVLPLRK
jgi:hypothetical protein